MAHVYTVPPNRSPAIPGSRSLDVGGPPAISLSRLSHTCVTHVTIVTEQAYHDMRGDACLPPYELTNAAPLAGEGD